jgi:outer membrane receptor protein involved in Fe transport
MNQPFILWEILILSVCHRWQVPIGSKKPGSRINLGPRIRYQGSIMIMSKYPFTVTQLKAALPAALFVAATLAQTPAVAQTSAADEAIEEITVTGIRRSLDVAADIKRESDSVVDAITAQDIGLFSDNNIGEALSRVPGVLLEREAGEGYRISIRGLGPRSSFPRKSFLARRYPRARWPTKLRAV